MATPNSQIGLLFRVKLSPDARNRIVSLIALVDLEKGEELAEHSGPVAALDFISLPGLPSPAPHPQAEELDSSSHYSSIETSVSISEPEESKRCIHCRKSDKDVPPTDSREGAPSPFSYSAVPLDWIERQRLLSSSSPFPCIETGDWSSPKEESLVNNNYLSAKLGVLPNHADLLAGESELGEEKGSPKNQVDHSEPIGDKPHFNSLEQLSDLLCELQESLKTDDDNSRCDPAMRERRNVSHHRLSPSHSGALPSESTRRRDSTHRSHVITNGVKRKRQDSLESLSPDKRTERKEERHSSSRISRRDTDLRIRRKLQRASEAGDHLKSKRVIHTRDEMQEFLDGLLPKNDPLELEDGEIRPSSSRKRLDLEGHGGRRSSRWRRTSSEEEKSVFDFLAASKSSTSLGRLRTRDHSLLLNGVERQVCRDKEPSPSPVKDREQFTLFFTKKYPFSNHYPCPSLFINGIQFNCTEQYYMYSKAVTFGDHEAAKEIMQMNDPKQMKIRSRFIRGFNKTHWDKVSKDVMVLASTQKYAQNEGLRRALFETHGTTLVEANPTDQRWGIGLGMDDLRAADRGSWRGENLLGEILTQLRRDFWRREEYKEEVREVKRALRKKKRLTI